MKFSDFKLKIKLDMRYFLNFIQRNYNNGVKSMQTFCKRQEEINQKLQLQQHKLIKLHQEINHLDREI